MQCNDLQLYIHIYIYSGPIQSREREREQHLQHRQTRFQRQTKIKITAGTNNCIIKRTVEIVEKFQSVSVEILLFSPPPFPPSPTRRWQDSKINRRIGKETEAQTEHQYTRTRRLYRIVSPKCQVPQTRKQTQRWWWYTKSTANLPSFPTSRSGSKQTCEVRYTVNWVNSDQH